MKRLYYPRVGKVVVFVAAFLMVYGVGFWKFGGSLVSTMYSLGAIPDNLMEWFVTGDNFDDFQFISCMLALVIGLPSLICGLSIMHPTAENVLSNDSRMPVLYLRAFNIDTLWGGESIEYEISRVFRAMGPVVCIGKPGERFAPTGAHRLYCDDDSWRGVVDDLAEKSSVILQASAETDGVLWEIDRILKSHRQKLILIVDIKTYTQLCGNISKVTGIEFPELSSLIDAEILKTLKGGCIPFFVDSDKKAFCPRLVFGYEDVNNKSFSMKKSRVYKLSLEDSLIEIRDIIIG